MSKVFFLFFTYSIFLFAGVNAYSVPASGIVSDSLNVKHQLSCLFVSKNEVVRYSKETGTDSVKGKFVDVSCFFNDYLELPFPGYEAVKCITNPSLLNFFYKNTSEYFALQGAEGIFYRNPGNRCSGVYTNRIGGMSGSDFLLKDIAEFDGLPLLKTFDSFSKADDRAGFIEDHYDFKYWIELFSNDTAYRQVSFEELLKKGYLFYTSDIDRSVEKIMRALNDNVLDSSLVMHYADKAYRFRSALSKNELKHDPGDIVAEQKKLRWRVWVLTMSVVQKEDVQDEQSFMLNNASYGILDRAGFFDGKYPAMYTEPQYVVPSDSLINKDDKTHQLIITVSGDDTISTGRLAELNSKYILKLIYTGSADKYAANWMKHAGCFEKILFIPPGIREADKLIEQALFGGIAINGEFPFFDLMKAKGFYRVKYEKLRLGYAFPELVSMNADTLRQIEDFLKEVVRKKMAPGGQLLIVKNGFVVYDKPFGYKTYSRKYKVKDEYLYDLASLTKIIVTIPEVMKLYENNQIDLNKKLKDYLPETDTTETGKIVIRKLLLHEAGLPSFVPFHLNYVDEKSFSGSMYSGRYSRKYSIRLDRHFFFNSYVRYRKDVFRHKRDSLFNIQLSKNMFMNYHFRDSVFSDIVNIKLHKKKDYRYSDLGYYFLQKIIERETGKGVDELFKQWFAIPLGTTRLLFNPLNEYTEKEIVPSGKDMIFRKEMLQGYPNDAGAAMMGGVAGHAGLFGNSCDIAKFAQMLLNKGSYGGVRFFDSSTIELFTSKQNDHNRRGLGFDKPEFDSEKDNPVSEYASEASYGHSGFTGTLLWIDPEYDLIYIFLSNRVYPYSYNKKLIRENIRTKIQDLIYKSITIK
jgi:CubicO group peptidase (beta-lactamase class C family)